MRQDLIASAVAFLSDPKVQSSTLTSRVEFLETKGLTQDEIQYALRQAESASPSAPQRPGAGVAYQQPPAVPSRDWRDLFIMSVISGGVVYGVVSLARKYLVPHLQPPSSPAFTATSTALETQFDQAQALLTALQAQTTALEESVAADRTKIAQVVEDVEDCVRGFHAAEQGSREEMRDFRDEVQSLKELVPKMIDKHTQSQSQALQDLQGELRSLKALLVSRQAAPAGGSGVASPVPRPASIPAWQMAGGSSTPSWKTPAPSTALTPDSQDEAKGKDVAQEEKPEGSAE